LPRDERDEPIEAREQALLVGARGCHGISTAESRMNDGTAGAEDAAERQGGRRSRLAFRSGSSFPGCHLLRSLGSPSYEVGKSSQPAMIFRSSSGSGTLRRGRRKASR
jgi:hypothetical protein